MRTRFLPTDYTAYGGGGPVGILAFVPLPLPQLSHLDYPSVSGNLLRCFDDIPIFGAFSDVEKLPIDDALSMFLSDVLPHLVDGGDLLDGGEKSEVIPDERSIPICYSKNEWDRLGSEYVEIWGKDGTTSNSMGRNGLKFLPFEIPEMDTSLLPLQESVGHSQVNCLHLSFEIPDVEFTVDALDSEQLLQNYIEIQQSVYSVDYVNIEDSIDQNADGSKDTDYLAGNINSNKIRFPLFELDVDDFSIPPKMYTMDELLSFAYIDKELVVPREDVLRSNMELLGSMEFDLIKYLLHDSSPARLAQMSSLSLLNNMSKTEVSQSLEDTFHEGKQDVNSMSSIDEILFDEFLFVDFNQFHISKLYLDLAKEIDAEKCESLFAEAMNFRSFSKLVVCHELSPVDNSFKSLPVPIFSDHGKGSSLLGLIEEILAQLDMVSSSVSDDLYLNWFILGEDVSESAKYSYCRKLLFELDTYKIDAAIISCSKGKLLFDFILSEEFSKTENCEEIVKAYTDPSKSSSSDKADLNSLRDHGDGERINQDIWQKSDAEKAPVFGESMSSDLQFFLDPRNYAKGRESIARDKSADIKAAHQLLMSNNDSDAADTTVAQEMPYVKVHQKEEFPSVSEQKGINFQREELVDTINDKKTNGSEAVKAVNGNEDCTSIPVLSMSPFLESKQNLFCKDLCPNTIIVVNTQNFSEEMIISRRTTYQRILEMEKEGAQVIERDINLPVDLVISSAVCLAWYDSRNIRRKASAPDEAFSSLPLCVESIAASILTSLSYAFGCFILIFEGEASFLHSIMESSDELYAAAASLGIDIQLFCSYSIEFTEEIILSCINVATKSSRGLYPKMSDSESLGESFLTAFPSVNPLSAHAILSSDAVLGKFLEMSDEGRIYALQRYLVPDESIALLSATSRFGEREDNKSGITDCSSTISVPESTNVLCKGESERKRPKHWHNTYDSSENLNDIFPIESRKVPQDDLLNLPKLSASCNSWLSGTTEIPDKSAQRSLSGQRSLSRGHDTDADLVNCFNKSRPCDFPIDEGLQVSYSREKPWMACEEVSCNPRTGLASKPNDRVDRHFNKGTGFQQKNFTGEVIDAEDTPGAFLEDFSLAKSSCFSPFLLDNEKDYADGNSRMYKRPFGATDSPMFNDPTDIDSACGAWVSRESNRQILMDEINPHSDTIKRSIISLTDHKDHKEKYMTKEAPQNSSKLPMQEKGIGIFDGMPHSNDLHSPQLQQGSPWTVEFLNRIREKSRLHKQSASHDLSSPGFGSTAKSSVTKRKSPSILEFYKYQGKSTQQKIIEHWRPKRSSEPLHSLKNKKALISSPSTLTPVDKRTRRTLSFSTNGSGGQRKLVWSDYNHHVNQRRF